MNDSANAAVEAEARSTVSKTTEIFTISSGQVVIIDQFMLGNEQFLSRLTELNDRSVLKEAVETYGGCLLTLDAGDYEVFRDPIKAVMLICDAASREAGRGNAKELGEDEESEVEAMFDAVLDNKGELSPSARVFVDTRCVVFIDAQCLFDSELISKYKGYRKAGEEKKARDLLRSRGGAVRYGFNRFGDELGVLEVGDGVRYALWPDVVE